MKVEAKAKMLANVRVLDLSRVLSGPFCTRMLCDLGAEVIKIETGDGDTTRTFPPFKAGHAHYFTQFNVGKKSLALNLRHPKALDLFKKLVLRSDVVLENYRPGTLAKMGLGYPVLKVINPRIILCSISGFGQDGPDAKRLAYTDTIQADCGMDAMAAQMIGPNAAPPGFPYSFGDTYASLNAAVAILTALYYRGISGEGQAIDISMFDCLVAANDSTLQKFIFSDGQDDRVGIAFRPPFRMKNGYMAAALFMAFDRVLQAMGKSELLQDERFNTMEARYKPENWSQFFEMFKGWARETTVEEASLLFEKYDIPYGKVNSVSEVTNSPVVRHRNLLAETEIPGHEAVRVVNTPFKFSGFPCRPQGPPPRLGEHNRSICRDLLNLPEREIEALIQEGILIQQKGF
jgi:CoA:oxalate CoA-transferase